jgi:hypothetical protein
LTLIGTLSLSMVMLFPLFTMLGLFTLTLPRRLCTIGTKIAHYFAGSTANSAAASSAPATSAFSISRIRHITLCRRKILDWGRVLLSRFGRIGTLSSLLAEPTWQTRTSSAAETDGKISFWTLCPYWMVLIIENVSFYMFVSCFCFYGMVGYNFNLSAHLFCMYWFVDCILGGGESMPLLLGSSWFICLNWSLKRVRSMRCPLFQLFSKAVSIAQRFTHTN